MDFPADRFRGSVGGWHAQVEGTPVPEPGCPSLSEHSFKERCLYQTLFTLRPPVCHLCWLLLCV